ncbi:XK-related protein 6-like [Lytechinus variegatus]|uniref:XK-related protein 6-like n=1 Tax=Lytechinus variegatus TaxID=7654 RepID=UPI001BB1CC7D|nr:XK-related protein 6-like [Lytechinus variegatus]
MSTEEHGDGEDSKIIPVLDISQEKTEKNNFYGVFDDEGNFTLIDALFFIVGMALYIADLVTDIVVGVQYFRRGDILWGSMTFVFVFVPSLVLQYFSLRWFVLDTRENEKDEPKALKRQLRARCQWLITHALQLGAIKRYWRTVKYGLRSRREIKYYNMMIYEYRDISMLRLLEAFMESAPQLVLQVYIMLESEEFHWLTAVSTVVSLGSLAFSLESYHKVLRVSRIDRLNISYLGVTFRILWRLFTITARVIAMALFASIYEWRLFVVVAVHWIGMTAWLIWQKTEFHDATWDEIPFDAVVGIIHIFCFFNMKEGHTRYRALAFYGVIFIENTILLVLWYQKQESREKIYAIPALGFVWGGFFVGLLFMALYYTSCHPTDDILCCIPPPWNKDHPKKEMNNTPIRLQSSASSETKSNAMQAEDPKRHRYFFSRKWILNKSLNSVPNEL